MFMKKFISEVLPIVKFKCICHFLCSFIYVIKFCENVQLENKCYYLQTRFKYIVCKIIMESYMNSYM